MAVRGRSPLLAAILLWMCFGRTEALTEPEICYVLDGILFCYGIILTALYCRIKVCMLRTCLEKHTCTKLCQKCIT
ncbi:hypothetical protein PAMA_014068 [Pampus argenteus]